jgi:2-polyprenyl-3-methyl-5-hydroxy-6-metoxy-1,4-benzoquinol methylase
MNKLKYVLITPARNEDAFIERTIQSVINQALLPEKWIIVCDSCTDRTDEIVRQYSEEHHFIQHLSLSGDVNRNFGAQVRAINSGYEQLKDTDYDYIGNLDADVTFDSDYYERILNEFQLNQKLGLAGGFIYERYNGKFENRPFNTITSVPHAIQLFRRQCYESIGGYIPLKYGGPDWCAEVMARMKGWQVESFPDVQVYHHRHTGSAGGKLHGMFSEGLRAFSVGSHPIFELFKCLHRIKNKPYLIYSFLRMTGYICGYFIKEKRIVSDEFVTYLRNEQKQKLLSRLLIEENTDIRGLDSSVRERLEDAFNRPSSEIFKKLQVLSRQTSSDHLAYMNNNSKAIDHKIARSMYVSKLIGHNRSKVLDFGCGCGFLSCILAATSADSVVGIEIDDSRRKTASYLANEIFRVENIEFSKTIEPLEKESFDAVLMTNVISHVRQLPMVLIKLVNLLKSNGVLFIEDNNNFGSIIVRRRLKRRVWCGERWDGEKVYMPMRLNYIKKLYPILSENQIETLAVDTYGLTYPEIDRFVKHWIENRTYPYDTSCLKNYAPVDPETGMYHENAFHPREIASFLFNSSLVPISIGPKFVFDYKRNLPISWLFKSFRNISLSVAPSFEILAIKK